VRGIVVLTTVGNDEQAYLIAREVLSRRQAACVNIVPAIRSLYRWKGKIRKDGELLLIIKTLETEYEHVAATIRELHSYELPEILSFEVQRGEQSFLDWVANCVDPTAHFDDEDDDSEGEVPYAADLDDTDD
jgi:periplasmic divalent cation tolerance protein